MFIKIKDTFGYIRFINIAHVTNIRPSIVVDANNKPPSTTVDGYIICLIDNTEIKISMGQVNDLILKLGERC